MNALEALRIAVGGIAANKLRSGLTILGMTIGVAAVIILVAVGNGSKKQVQASIDALGTNVLIVQGQGGAFGPGAFRLGGGATTAVELTTSDAKALQDSFNAPDVKSASPVLNSSQSLTTSSTSYTPASLVGTTAGYLTARSYDISTGTGITDAQVRRRTPVIVLGPTVVQSLFGGQSPVGQTVKIGDTSFQIVGETKAKGSNGTTDQDDVAFVPITALQDAVAGYGSISQIVVQAKSSKQLNAAQAEVTSIIEQRHGVTDTSSPGFQVINQGSVRAVSDASTSVFTTLLGAVAAISLLVGGIGVMNIMLVSVTERTREIGIRKAIGARRSDILGQFLTEAVMVSVFGGLVGVAAGILGSHFEIAGVHPSIELYSVFLAFGAAVLCGLFFGTYPAARAAFLRPIDALRFE